MSGPGRDPTVTDEEILEVFDKNPDPILTTREVADAIGMGRRGTYDRLRSLANDGTLEMKKVGGRSAVWWSPELLRRQFKQSPDSDAEDVEIWGKDDPPDDNTEDLQREDES